MRWEVRRLERSHNRDLLALAATSSTGSDAFTVDRSPDFFALSRELGDSEYLGAFDGGHLVGCIGVARQRRFLGGVPSDVPYLNDLRVAPRYRGTGVFATLLGNVVREWGGHGAWGFATILDSNTHGSLLTRRNALLAAARPIGRTLHVGSPLFLPRRGSPGAVRLGAHEAWDHYHALAAPLDFAPADRQRFADGGSFFLGLPGPGGMSAVCKVVDQSPVRRLVATQPSRVPMKLASILCRLAGRAPLPGRGQVFRHAYLSHCVGDESTDFRQRFVNHLSRSTDHDFSYVFAGLAEGQRRSGPLDLTLTSTTWGYGAVPAGLTLGFRELTLI